MLLPLPAGLPSPNPTRGYWQEPASPLAEHRTTSTLPKAVDYAIVGSGITGASIAHGILQNEPDASVVLLEAREVCSGASGRNGGHCRAGRYLTFYHDKQCHGKEEAMKMSRFEEHNVYSVQSFIREKGLDCDLEPVETIDLFSDTTAWKDAVQAVEARREAFSDDIKHRLQDRILHDAIEAKERFQTPNAVGAISFSAWTLSPYKFTCGLLELGLRLGLNLQTYTPVLSITRASSHDTTRRWALHTARGCITARTVILATNAYSSHLYPAIGKALVPTRAQCTVQRPGSTIAGSHVLTRSIGFVYPSDVPGNWGSDYMMTRASGLSGEGDIIFGGGRLKSKTGEQPLTDDTKLNPTISRYLKQALRNDHFGKENWGQPGPTVHEWTGIMGYTTDGQPIIGQVPHKDGFWMCVGFNGHGMALAFRSAQALVEIMLGKDPEEVNAWLPESFRIERLTLAKCFPPTLSWSNRTGLENIKKI